MAGRSALVTVMFTDIVNSTDIAGEMGDRRWRELIARHHRIVRSELRKFGGREIDTAGDGFFAAFDRPAEAVRCACSIVQAVRTLGIEVRAGVHVGEAEVMGKGLSGMAVHTGARIAALGGPGEVLVSGTLRDLVPGATFGFDDRGIRQLKGVREAPRVLAVVEVDETPVAPPMDAHEAAARRRAIAPPPTYRRRPVRIAAVVAGVVAVGVAVFLAAGGDEPATSEGPVHDVAVRVDPEVGRVDTPISLGGNFRSQLLRPQVAVGEGGVWVMNGECVCHIDPETGEVTSPEVPFPSQMALGHRAVWVASLNSDVYSINEASVEASDRIPLPVERQVLNLSIATTEDAVWVAFSSALARVDPVSGDISDPIELNHGADDVLGVGPDLWVVDELRRTLYRYGPDGREIDSVPLQFTPDDLAAGPNGSLWVLNTPGGTVTEIGPDGELQQPIRVGANPVDVAVVEGAVWVADREGQTVQRIDPTLEQKDPPIHLPGPVGAIGVDPATGEVWAFLD